MQQNDPLLPRDERNNKGKDEKSAAMRVDSPSSSAAHDSGVYALSDSSLDTSMESSTLAAAGIDIGVKRATFTAAEIRAVVARYDIGRVKSSRGYAVGSRRAAKVKLIAKSGVYLLKRLDPGNAAERVLASHLLHELAARAGIPVAQLARVRGASRDAATLLELDGNLYEMQEWIEAERCARNEAQARAAGIALATMHREFQKFDVVVGLPQGGFSDFTRVRLKLSRALQRLNESIDPAHQSALRSVGALLDAHVMRAGDKLEAKGIALQREMPCHGDFHPGNTMWVGDTLRAVIDFDRARTEFVAAEISNAMLQFSTHPRAGSDPLAWTVGLEAERLRGFAEGYRAVNAIDLSAVAPFAPWLMVCAVVSEAAFPIATEGSFAGIPGLPVLQAAASLVEWIGARTRAISESMLT